MAIEGTREKSREFKCEVRECCGECEGEEKKREVRVSVSSEAPVVETVFDEESGEWVRGLEVLGHAEGEIDFSRMDGGLVIQDTHRGDQIGLIRNVEVKDGKLGGVIEFCCGDRAQEIRKDAECGLRRNMSVGYIVNAWRKCGDGDKERGILPTYRAVSWTPYEASFVNVPADTRVGVDRSLDVGTDTAAQTAATNERDSNMENTENTPAVDNSAEIRALKDEIVSLREAVKKPEMPAERAKPQFDEADAPKIARQYNLMNAIRALAGDRVDVGFEREISDEIAHQSKREAKGLFIPDMILSGRAFDKGNTAGQLVATETLFGEMVPALVAKTVLGAAGVRTLSGLQGDIKIPTGAAASAAWGASEGANATETTPTIGHLSATPKGLAAYTDITRELTLQAGISPQAFITNALLSAMARKLEEGAFSGSGSNGQPTGLDNTIGINTISSATNPDLVKLLEFITTPESENANVDGGKFIGRPNVWSLLGSTFDKYCFNNTGAKASSSVVGGVAAPRYLLDTTNDKCQGYDFIKSNIATAKYLYFGDWSKMLICLWSGVDVTVDPYSLSLSGKLRIVAHQNVDVVVTQPKAFARGQVIA